MRHSIPPTLLISAIGVIEDITQTVTMDLKDAGNFIYLIGDFPAEQKPVPDVPASTLQTYRALHQVIRNGHVRSAHDLSEGGLAVAAAEMCIGGRLGMELNIESSNLFSEVNGCLLLEVSPVNVSAFEKQFADSPCKKIGAVIAAPILKIAFSENLLEALVHAFNIHLS